LLRGSLSRPTFIITMTYQTLLLAGYSGRDAVRTYRDYHRPGYYAAVVLDPDGNNIEAVWYDLRRMIAQEYFERA
jgi:hypothetical protein